MARLKIELGRYHNVVFGRVLEQDEALRRCKDLPYPLVGACYPGLYDDRKLFIRGIASAGDARAFCCSYSTDEIAESVIAAIKSAVRQVNAGIQPCEDGVVRVEIVE